MQHVDGILTPEVFRDVHGDVRALRVWPGPEGRELFRLQLRGLLKKRIQDPAGCDVIFCIEAGGLPGRPTPPLLLPGLASYGVASYCAAIGEALATRTTKCTTAAAAGLSQFPAAVDQHHHAATAAPTDTDLTSASGPGGGGGDDGGDDWIELLCSVADMMEGKEVAEGEGGGEGVRGEEGWRRQQQQQQQLLPPVLPPSPTFPPSTVRVWVHICRPDALPAGADEVGYREEQQE
ncbi:hypothetical protein PLESTB_001809600 [Pleodorina starrii]|uniref:Uncharacterized protein n=1 Tax=Pleodorina starrii TaxID=330485 RepID=A0A9W6F9Z0_9CHLO|nr:hypothetical protein PLESTM_000905700 [Pleodorina starrii]GLC61844.1 hypothetical protein PLESTB_001809600 [Pleodorina starrii]GLC76905.1 hypothetical protein PLESTF_001854000 [Pleodorina starrii]